MSIPSRLTQFLDRCGAQYEVCAHPRSRTSAQSARTAHVPLHQLAKSVLLEDEGGVVMAVVPADKRIMLRPLARLLERDRLHLADEERIAALFVDCDRGALPALGAAWGVETVVDDDLDANEVLYIEAGDHERLLRMSRAQFHDLTAAARHGRFSAARVH